MHPAFASYFLGECPKVCGWKLLPLQLGHVALLDAVGSPFMSGEAVTVNDVVAAAWACSRPATAAMSTRRKWYQLPRMREGVEHHAAILREYLAFHMQSPRRFPSSNARKCRVPWQFATAHRLCGGDWAKIGFAWNTPMLEATARSFTEDDAAGDDSIRTEDDEIGIIAARKELASHG